MKRITQKSLILLSGLVSVFILSSFFHPLSGSRINESPDDEISYRSANKKQAHDGALHFATAFENDYYTSSQRTGHFYAEIQTDDMRGAPGQDIPMNIAIVIDRSGSMSGQKIHNARQAAKYIVDQLDGNDYLSIVMYDQVVEVVYPSGRVENREQIKSRIDRITDRGSTNLMGGALKGYDEVKRNFRSGYINRVLLLSDGLANEGITSPSEIERIVRRKNTEDGISISTFGVGNDYNEDLMTAMAETGTGNYYFISRPQDIAGIFQKELNGLKDVVAQEAELEIRLPEFVNIDKVYGPKFSQEGRKLRIRFHDLFAHETKGVLIRYTVDANRNTPVRFDARLSYRPAQLDASRALSLNSRSDYTDSRGLYNEHFSEWVSAQVALYESNERLERAMKEVDKGNYQEAKKMVKENKDYMKSKAPLVNKSVELQKAESVNATYEENIREVEAMPTEDVKYLQKASKSSNYEIRTKKK